MSEINTMGRAMIVIGTAIAVLCFGAVLLERLGQIWG